MSIRSVSPFRKGEVLTAEKLDILREVLEGHSRSRLTNAIRKPEGVISNNRTVISNIPIAFINGENALPSYSIFTLDKSITETSGGRSEPWLKVDVDNSGLTYYTNEDRGIGPNGPFYARNISNIWPALLRYDDEGVTPNLGEECGPTNDGTGRIKGDGQGFVCIQVPDTTNKLVWVQALGGASSALRIGVLQDHVAPCATEFVDLYKQEDETCPPIKKSPVESIECMNFTSYTLYSGPLMYVQTIEAFNYPAVFPAQIEECGFTNQARTVNP